jgi:hypothetical protein
MHQVGQANSQGVRCSVSSAVTAVSSIIHSPGQKVVREERDIRKKIDFVVLLVFS